MWWVQILKSFPSHKFNWKTTSERRLCDLFTDASAEDRWGGLGAVLFFGHMRNGRTMRVNNVPEVLLPFLPSKSEQKVRIAVGNVRNFVRNTIIWFCFEWYVLSIPCR